MPDIMGDMDIAFPHLGIYLENVPKSFTVFGFTIALYGVIIGCGVLLAVLLTARIAKATGQDPEMYWDYAVYLVVFSVIGARVYYVIFSWDLYKNDPISVLYLRNGGLAIYGGILTGFLTNLIYARVRKKSYWLLADTVIYGVVLGQIIGRWGNFTNREAFGQYSDGLLAMRIPTAMVRANEITESIAAHMSAQTNYIQVHPTFLYESLWNCFILLLMLLYLRRKKFDGEITLLYLGGYGIGRFFIESLRTDQLHLWGTNLAVSQLLGLSLFLLAVLVDASVRGRQRRMR